MRSCLQSQGGDLEVSTPDGGAADQDFGYTLSPCKGGVIFLPGPLLPRMAQRDNKRRAPGV